MEVPVGFVEVTENGFYILTRPAYFRKAVELARIDPETVLSGRGEGALLAAGPMQGRGARVELPGEGGETIIFKKKRRGGLYGRLVGDVHSNDYNAISEVVLAETAWKKGVPVALMAFGMSGAAGAGRKASLRRGYLASIKLPGARTLMEWLSEPNSAERRSALVAAAHAVARAHDRGFAHGDLNLGNILVVRSERGELGGWLIDVSHGTLGGTLRLPPRLGDLVRLYRSAEKWLPAAGAAERRRRGRDVVGFLRAYTSGQPGGVRRILEAAAPRKAGLLLRRLRWKATGAGAHGRARP